MGYYSKRRLTNEIQKFSTTLYSEKINKLLSDISSQGPTLEEDDLDRIWYPYKNK